MPDDPRQDLAVLKEVQNLLIKALADLDDDVRALLRARFAVALADIDPAKGALPSPLRARLEELLAMLDPNKPEPPKKLRVVREED